MSDSDEKKTLLIKKSQWILVYLPQTVCSMSVLLP